MAEFDPYYAWLGIPKAHRPPTYYQLLGVDPSVVDGSVVKALALQRIAFVRNFQRSEHAETCARILEELALAESTLTNPTTRAAYDVSLKAATVAAVPAKAIAKPIPAKVSPAVEKPRPTRPAKRSGRHRQTEEAMKWLGRGAIAVVGIVVVVWAGSAASGPKRNEANAKSSSAPLVANYETVPEDATAVVASNNAKINRNERRHLLEADEASIRQGVSITFSKPGYVAKTVKVDRNDLGSSSNVRVVLEREPKRTATVSVKPVHASVTVRGGDAARSGAEGEWTVTASPGVTNGDVTVSADGFSPKTVPTTFNGSQISIALGVKLAGALKHYQSLGENAALRLVDRVGLFGGSVGKLALSRNGKFLAVVEGCSDPNIHLWDVDKGAFFGPVMDTKAKGSVEAATTAIAVSNDGKFIAIGFRLLSVFDAVKGTEVYRSGSERASLSAVLGLAFSLDDSKLYLALGDGRIEVRRTSDWNLEKTMKGLKSEPSRFRISGDGVVATADSVDGILRWERAEEESTILERRTKSAAERLWSAPPGGKHYLLASASSDELQVRKYDDPGVAVKEKTSNKHPIVAVEALGRDLAAVVVNRTGPRASSNRPGDFALRIWNHATERVLTELSLPGGVYDVSVSDDGSTFATVAERELVVYVWRVNPKGDPNDRYVESVDWEPLPLQRWIGADWNAVKFDGNPSLFEIESGGWKLTRDGSDVNYAEIERTPRNFVVARGFGSQYVFYNNGHVWARNAKQFRGFRLGVPDEHGMIWRTHEDKADFLHMFRGRWERDDLPARAANSN